MIRLASAFPLTKGAAVFDPLTRRHLLRRSIVVAAGAVTAGLGTPARLAMAAEAGAGAAEKPRMHFGTVTYMLGAKMDLPTLIDVCEKGGVEGVELRTTHAHGVEPSLDAEGRAKVKERFAKSKVRLAALGSVCEFHSPDPAAVKKNIETCNKFVQLAADVGAWGVKVRPNGLPKEVPEDKTLRQIGESVRECGEVAKDKGIVIVVECHGGGTADPARMAKIMEYCKHPSVGLCWNSNGGDVKNGSIREGFDLCKAWIRHAHVTNLGGNYPWAELFTLLKGINYTGYTLLETDTKGDAIEFLRGRRAAWEKLAL
jgi:sugar phosphate isomerase/epimerase